MSCRDRPSACSSSGISAPRAPGSGRKRRGFQSGFLRGIEALEGRALLATVTVHVADFAFIPKAVTIQPGDTVHWVWDEGLHSTTSVAGSAETWDSDVHNTPGFSFDHTFTKTGTFAYFCTIHGFDNRNGTAGGMSGTVTVSASTTLQSIAVTPANPSLAVGATQQLTATGTFSDRSTRDLTGQVTWASATPSVATVSSTGTATGVSPGTSVVTASLTGVTGSTVLTVAAAPQAPTLTGEQRLFSGKGRRQKLVGFELRFSAAQPRRGDRRQSLPGRPAGSQQAFPSPGCPGPGRVVLRRRQFGHAQAGQVHRQQALDPDGHGPGRGLGAPVSTITTRL